MELCQVFELTLVNRFKSETNHKALFSIVGQKDLDRLSPTVEDKANEIRFQHYARFKQNNLLQLIMSAVSWLRILEGTGNTETQLHFKRNI